MGQTVALHTLGCKVNQQDSDGLSQLFLQAGYKVVDFKDKADIYIINTCTVTHLGDRKSRQMIRRAINENPLAKIVVTGCYAQTSPGDILEIAGVDLIIGTKDRNRIVHLVEQVNKGQKPLNLVADVLTNREFEELPLPSTSRTRAFIKVQEGCNQFCTYCIVPYARGPIRSRPIQRVLEEAKQLEEQGYQEIVLSGTHIGMYGRDVTERQVSLATLVEALVTNTSIERLRISSLEPHDLTPELLEILVGSPMVCPHFHLPLQSGDNRTLEQMKRPYTREHFAQLVEKLRQKDNQTAFTTDVMVGFPGETEAQFQNTVKLLEEIGFADLHVFKYSPRKGTPAATFPHQIHPEIKEERSQHLLQLAAKLQAQYASKFVNEVRWVLVEKIWQADKGKKHPNVELIYSEQEIWEGLTDNYLRVLFPAEEVPVKGLLPVKLERFQDGYMLGSKM